VYKFIGLDGNPGAGKAAIGGQVLMGEWESAGMMKSTESIEESMF